MRVPNFGYHFARRKARAIRAAYAAALEMVVPRRVTSNRTLSFDVCSYSGRAMLPEQVASIRSLLRHAGRPDRFVVFSDGTHSDKEIQLLHAVAPCVEVRQVPSTSISSRGMRTYLEQHPTGRQLAVMMALPLARPTFYIDSDVLFFPGAKDIEVSLAAAPNAPALYLRDCQLAADNRLFRNPSECDNPVNTGIIYFRRQLDWSIAAARFAELNGEPTFHTNQTLTHLAMHANGAAPLDPTKFVLQLDDQFIRRDLYARPDIVARHYVNPVRHKFWTALLK